MLRVLCSVFCYMLLFCVLYYVISSYTLLCSASDISRVAMSPLLLVATLVVVQLAAAATIAEQPSQITDEELKSINKVNDLDTKWVTIMYNVILMLGSSLSRESFRCGLFFPPEVAGELPIAPLYIFNASFPAPECPTQEAERFVQFCHSIVSMSRAGAGLL